MSSCERVRKEHKHLDLDALLYQCNLAATAAQQTLGNKACVERPLDSIDWMIVRYLARTGKQKSDSSSVIPFLVRRLHRIALYSKFEFVYTRPSWLCAYDTHFKWTRSSLFVKVVNDAYEADSTLRKFALLNSSAIDEIDFKPDEWFRLSVNARDVEEAITRSYQSLDVVAVFLQAYCSIGHAKTIGLPWKEHPDGPVLQRVFVEGVEMDVRFDNLSKWSQACRWNEPFVDSDKLDRSIRILSQTLECLQKPDLCQTREKALAKDIILLSRWTRKIQEKRMMLSWPFVITYKNPLVMFENSGRFFTWVRVRPDKKHLLCERHYLIPSMLLYGAQTEPCYLRDVPSQIENWMYRLFKGRLAPSNVQRLFDKDALESKTHYLWRSLHHVETEQVSFLATEPFYADVDPAME